MNIEDASEHANALVRKWLTGRYREGGDNQHLRKCESLTVGEVDGGDGSYRCDTGCEYVRLEAVVSCPHGERDDFEYGDFNELHWLLEDLLKEEGENVTPPL